ncbi:Cytochrome c oxidase assembly protein PET [Trema orientale]|uniref:Cytochrome c oxidase assembly protein PET n=1 Tax=Trema orientale TaxID=63057 RepID=A0A2P5ETS3_TREOI|nr:Cytochrome c oxidase assembly protein PET [Trema orientale]
MLLGRCGLSPPSAASQPDNQKGLAMELVKCLGESDCVKVEKRSFRECAGEKSPSIPSECVGLRETYFNCKRGQVDMRARIRGNKGY